MERDPLAYEEALSRATEHHQRGTHHGGRAGPYHRNPRRGGRVNINQTII